MKTYLDFKEGEKVLCVKNQTEFYQGGDIGNERIIIGKYYTIYDLDFHFPDKICVKLSGPYYRHQEWIPIECFEDVNSIRDYKIDQILNI